jgi:hypothetical protein
MQLSNLRLCGSGSSWLGDNSAFNLASKALEKIGLARKKKRVRGKGFFSSIKKGSSSFKDKLSNVKERITTVFTSITSLNSIPYAETYLSNTVMGLFNCCRQPSIPYAETYLSNTVMRLFNRYR